MVVVWIEQLRGCCNIRSTIQDTSGFSGLPGFCRFGTDGCFIQKLKNGSSFTNEVAGYNVNGGSFTSV